MINVKKSIALGLIALAAQLSFSPNIFSGENYWNDLCCYQDVQHAGLQPVSFAAFDTGYRIDRFNQEQIQFHPLGSFLGTEIKMFKDIESVQFGAKGAFFYQNFYVKGSGYYGVIYNGNFSVTNLDRYDVKGQTWDGSGAIGYIMNCNECLAVAPIVGFSHHFLKFQGSNGITGDLFFGIPNNHPVYEIDFCGPFVGFDLFFQACDWQFNAGYELHFGEAHHKYSIAIEKPEFGIFNFTGTNENMVGNVFHFDAMYAKGCNWSYGFGLKYTYWGQKASGKDKIPEDDFVETQRTLRLQWHSFTPTITLGYSF